MNRRPETAPVINSRPVADLLSISRRALGEVIAKLQIFKNQNIDEIDHHHTVQTSRRLFKYDLRPVCNKKITAAGHLCML